MSELKVCAHCGHEAARKELRYYGETETWAYCPNPDCPMHDRTMTIKAWQTRPIEDALNARIAELELRLDVYNGNMYDVVVDENAKANKRITELEAEIDQLTAHDATERQDDKSPNDTQTSTIVYGKEREE